MVVVYKEPLSTLSVRNDLNIYKFLRKIINHLVKQVNIHNMLDMKDQSKRQPLLQETESTNYRGPML